MSVIFGVENKLYEPPVYDGLYNSMEYFKNYVYYNITKMIDSKGSIYTLSFVCIISALMFLLKNVFRYLAVYFIVPVSLNLSKNLKDALNKKILELPIDYFSDRRKGDIISRVITDVNIIKDNLLIFLSTLMRDPFMIIFSMAILFFISYKLTIFVIISLPISGIIISYIGSKLKSSASEAQKQEGSVLSFLDEIVVGLKVIKLFNVADKVQKIFEKRTSALTKNLRKVLSIVEIASPLSEFMGILVMLSILFFGGVLILGDYNSSMSGEDLITYLIFFFQTIQPSKSIARLFYESKKAVISIDRVATILNQKNDIRSGEIRLEKFKDCIGIDKAYFAYDEKYVIKNFSLKIKKGTTTALVGTSGSGKSTIANLLARFYDLKKGKITMDGIDIKDINLEDLRRNIGLITQDTILFNDTIYNNITFGMDNLTKEQVVHSTKIANAHDFIMELKYAYDTKIGDRGDKLSGGQKQRLHIARAILRDYPIIIFDEATSSLDAESEKLIHDSLVNIMKDKTVIVITHRLSTIKKADNIIVIRDGEIEEIGSHKSLIEKKGFYSKLLSFQQIN